jgi:metal-responsive CopG/Arc/MetJ family transcriptional regulator
MSKCEPTENVSVSVPISLLAITDHFCKEADLTRSQAFNRAIRLYLGTKFSKQPSFWAKVYNELVETGKIKDL